MHGKWGAIYLDDPILQIKMYQKQHYGFTLLRHNYHSINYWDLGKLILFLSLSIIISLLSVLLTPWQPKKEGKAAYERPQNCRMKQNE